MTDSTRTTLPAVTPPSPQGVLTGADLPADLVATVLAHLPHLHDEPDAEAYVRAVLMSYGLDDDEKLRYLAANVNRAQRVAITEVMLDETEQFGSVLLTEADAVYALGACAAMSAHMCAQWADAGCVKGFEPSLEQALHWAAQWLPTTQIATNAQTATGRTSDGSWPLMYQAVYSLWRGGTASTAELLAFWHLIDEDYRTAPEELNGPTETMGQQNGAGRLVWPPTSGLLIGAHLSADFVAKALAHLPHLHDEPDAEAYVRAVLMSYSLNDDEKLRCLAATVNRAQRVDITKFLLDEAVDFGGVLFTEAGAVYALGARAAMSAHMCCQRLVDANTVPLPEHALRWVADWLPSTPVSEVQATVGPLPDDQPPWLEVPNTLWQGVDEAGLQNLLPRWLSAELGFIHNMALNFYRGPHFFRAQPYLERASAYAKRLVDEFGRDDLRLNALDCNFLQAIVYAELGELDRAIPAYRDVLGEIEELMSAPAHADNVELQITQALAHCNLANALEHNGNGTDAVAQHQHGLALLDQLIQAHQSDTKTLHRLQAYRAPNSCNLAVAFRSLKQYSKAVQHFSKGINEYQALISDAQLHSQGGDHTLRAELAYWICDLANTLAAKKWVTAANRLFKQGVGVYRRIQQPKDELVRWASALAKWYCNWADALAQKGEWARAVRLYRVGLEKYRRLIDDGLRHDLRAEHAHAVIALARHALKYPGQVPLPELVAQLVPSVQTIQALVFERHQRQHVQAWVQGWGLCVQWLAALPNQACSDFRNLYFTLSAAFATHHPPLAAGDALLRLLDGTCEQDLAKFEAWPSLRLAHTRMALRWLYELLAESTYEWLQRNVAKLEAVSHLLWQACAAQGTDAVADWFFHTQGLQAQRRALWGNHADPRVQEYLAGRETLQALQERLLARRVQEPAQAGGAAPSGDGAPASRSSLLGSILGDDDVDPLVSQVKKQWDMCSALRQELTTQGLLPSAAVATPDGVLTALAKLARQRSQAQAVCLLVRGDVAAAGTDNSAGGDSVHVLLLWATPQGGTGAMHGSISTTVPVAQGSQNADDAANGPGWGNAAAWLAQAEKALDSINCRQRRGVELPQRGGYTRTLQQPAAPMRVMQVQAANALLASVAQCWAHVTQPLATWLKGNLAPISVRDQLPCVHLLPADDLHQLPWHHSMPWAHGQLRVWPTLGDFLRQCTVAPAPAPAPSPARELHWAMAAYAAMDDKARRLPMVALEAALTQHLWSQAQPALTKLPLEVLGVNAPTTHWPPEGTPWIDVLLSSGHGGTFHNPKGSRHGRKPAATVAGAGVWMGAERRLDAQTLRRVKQPTHHLVMACVLGKTDDWLGEPLGPIAAAFGQSAKCSVGWLVRVDDLAACLASLSLQYALRQEPSAVWVNTVLAVQHGWLEGEWPDGFAAWLGSAVNLVGPDLVLLKHNRTNTPHRKSAWCGELERLVKASGSPSKPCHVSTPSQIKTAWKVLAQTWAKEVPKELQLLAPYMVILGDA